MTNKQTPTTKTTTGEKVAIGAGITGLLVAATLGANFLFNTKKGKQSLKHIRSWAFKMKGDVLEKLENAKEINQEVYNRVIDELGEKYKKAKGMTIEEVGEVVNELKGQWRKVSSEIKKTIKTPNAKPKAKPRAAAKPKTVSTKTK